VRPFSAREDRREDSRPPSRDPLPHQTVSSALRQRGDATGLFAPVKTDTKTSTPSRGTPIRTRTPSHFVSTATSARDRFEDARLF